MTAVKNKAPKAYLNEEFLTSPEARFIRILTEYVEPYFASLLPVWESRTYKIAEYLIFGLYPAPLANVELRDATRAWLESHADAAPALRRLVAENLAGVERALAVQERDGQ